MGDFRQLTVWQKAHTLALNVHKASRGFPKEELYALTSQTRRAAFSIPANIAEGAGRKGDKEFIRFLRIAMGSANELEYHLLASHDLGFLESTMHRQLEHDLIEIKRMINGLIHHLRSRKPTD